MTKSTILILIAIVVIAGAGFLIVKSQTTAPNIFSINPRPDVDQPSAEAPVNPVACTMEAKLCPDDSYVGRTGPNCEFALCPPISLPISNKSGIIGRVILSPTCPVERFPPDPNCAPKPYSTSINISKTGSTKIIKTIQSDKNGAFQVDLSGGTYSLQAQGGKTLPRCSEVTLVVKSGQYIKTEISCDTGIR